MQRLFLIIVVFVVFLLSACARPENALPNAGASVSSAPSLAVSLFPDVPPEHWAYDAIAWAVENGIVKGFDDGTYRPNNTVTEAEFLAMLINAYRPPMPGQYQHWADPYYAFAEEMNWPVEGTREIIKRSVEIPRVRVAEIVAAADGANLHGDDAIRYLIRKGLAKGKKPGEASVESFAGDDHLTRAESVAFIRNLKESGLKTLKARPAEPGGGDQ